MLPWVLLSVASVCVCLFLLSYISYDSVIEPGLGIWVEGVIEVGETMYAARLAGFGPHPPLEGWPGPRLEAQLVVMDDDSCEPIPRNLYGAIGLVLRGNCSFVDKILNLQYAGASAVIVGNDIEGSLVMMGALGVDIPAMSVSHETWRTLKDHHANDIATLWARPQEYDVISTLVLFIVRPLMLLAILSTIMSVNLYHDRVRRRASLRMVSKLPTHIYHSGHEPHNAQSCAICLEDFDSLSQLMTLPCTHVYHAECVSRWLVRQRNVCPLCRRSVSERSPLLAN